LQDKLEEHLAYAEDVLSSTRTIALRSLKRIDPADEIMQDFVNVQLDQYDDLSRALDALHDDLADRLDECS
jgi:hypothetical protein